MQPHVSRVPTEVNASKVTRISCAGITTRNFFVKFKSSCTVVVDKKFPFLFHAMKCYRRKTQMDQKCKWNRNATESLTFRSCNYLKPQMQYLVFHSTFPNLPPYAKIFRTSYYYLLLFSYSGEYAILRHKAA